MPWVRKEWMIEQDGVYVGGYSLKRNRIWFTSQIDRAKKFTPLQVNAFLALHVQEDRGLDITRAKLIRTTLKEKMSNGAEK